MTYGDDTIQVEKGYGELAPAGKTTPNAQPRGPPGN
jgi:hypothetical protein